MSALKKLFLHELAISYDSEQQLVQALPTMAKAATCKNLQKLILAHLKQTESHVKKLESVFKSFDKKAQGLSSSSTSGLLKEGDETARLFKDSPAINSALITSAQRVEHYEIASYGALHEWAGLLDNEKAATLLEEILEEEKTANESLAELARSSSNREALGEAKVGAQSLQPVAG